MVSCHGRSIEALDRLMGAEAALEKRLALVLWAKDANGADDVSVFAGRLVEEDGRYYFQRTEGSGSPELDVDWLPRIRAVPDDLRATLLDCEFELALSVGELPADDPGFVEFGLRLP